MAQDEGVTLSDLVKEMRLRRDLTQVQLAAAAGVSESMIANVESGKRLLSADSLDAVANALSATDKERAELVAARLRQKRPTEPTNADLDRKLDRILALLEPGVGKPARKRGGDGTPSSMPRPVLKDRS